eukprot:TRINITY_DN12843_c0_g3_i3.p3 TRINITY_DN12843_c0_g3~~TRINITY_DN12843_c0_g3_i3.p3  ORF type:complete len:234 (-),score=100.86 TRINITY_DN12843_c0_g3_i3:1420-2121(-)
MAENFIDEYNKEDSVSSVSGDEEPKKVFTQHKSPETAAPRPEQSAEVKEVAPYTFNPKDVLKGYDSSARTRFDYSYSVKGYSPSSYGTRAKDAFQHRPKESLTARGEYVSVLNEDPSEYRRSSEYAGHAKEFDKKYDNSQREVEQVTRDLNAKTNKIDGFIQELRNPNFNMLLYKNRLERELEDVKNDLREAYNNISVLMNDRSNMKDQFCIYKVKLNKLKGFLKTYQEDAQA